MKRTTLALLVAQMLVAIAAASVGALNLTWPRTLPAELRLEAMASSLLIGLGVALLCLTTGLLATRAWEYLPPPSWTRTREDEWAGLREQVLRARRDGERKTLQLSEALEATREKARIESEHRQRLEVELGQLSRGLEQFPRELLSYYSNGVRSHGSEEVRGLGRSITAPWRAVEGTMGVEFLEPFFDQVQRVVKDYEAANPVHHYSSTQVLGMFQQISETWRKDEWFQKALRWMEQRYGSK